MSPQFPAFPEPLIYAPTSSTHSSTIIILHGRGSNATTFGPPLLSHPIPSFTSLRSTFPNTKFIFPTAPTRRATTYKRSKIPQWFDGWHQTESGKREELTIDGLVETSAFVHELLRREREVVGAENVVLGGLSQGCAAVMISLLLWEGEPITGAFGLCGYLPYCEKLQAVASGERREWYAGGSGEDGGDDEENSFADDFVEGVASEGFELKPPELAIALLRDELGLSDAGNVQSSLAKIPVFLAHGAEDEKVAFATGKHMSQCMRLFGSEVVWKEYSELGHWYSSDMLRDLCEFLKGKGL